MNSGNNCYIFNGVERNQNAVFGLSIVALNVHKTEREFPCFNKMESQIRYIL